MDNGLKNSIIKKQNQIKIANLVAIEILNALCWLIRK